ncbi:phospho-N-acetylmuramoyl-pentapeptide-transferase [bacterium]|nr:phospho-N-acetylmuramoyl-pentapeptide-transferase [bacterium]
MGVVLCTLLLFGNLTKPDVWLFLLALGLFGGIGLLDDVYKIRFKRGISARLKFRLQLLASILVTIAWLGAKRVDCMICLPFIKSWLIPVGLFIVPWAMFVLIGTSNAVNLTDGLDGLAIGSLIINFSVFSVISYLAGHAEFSHYLHIPFADSAEVVVVGAALIGASLGFLWFNAHPAQIFMGDVGSLSLGGALALMALISRQELLLGISGGLFVLETVSVILQYISVKYFKKRIFKMAPIHHHFELLGWPESQITMRFTIISMVLGLLALITLKLR